MFFMWGEWELGLSLDASLLWTRRLFFGQFAGNVDATRNFIYFGQDILRIVLEEYFTQEHETLLESCFSLSRNIMAIF